MGTMLVRVGESPVIEFGAYIEYLTSRQLDIYIERCRERLLTCDFSYGMFAGLLDYWVARHPFDYAQVLRENYLKLKVLLRDQKQKGIHGVPTDHAPIMASDLPYWYQLSPLLVLLSEDDDWAWEEMRTLVSDSDVPIDDHDLYVPYYRQLRFPLNSARLPILADWYANIRKRAQEVSFSMLDKNLLSAIVQIGGDRAITELRRLIAEQTYPGVEWLSHTILQIEDARLSVVEHPLKAGELLDFINREAFGVVQNNRDLYEWVRQAIEEVRDAIELEQNKSKDIGM